MWTIWLGCAPAPAPPLRWPDPADPEAARRLVAAQAYLAALDASSGDPPTPLVGALGDCGAPARDGDADCRALHVTWLLDAEVRRASRDARTLRDVVAAAPDPVDVAGWRGAAEEAAGRPLPAWSAQDAGAGALDYGAALDWFGLAWDDRPDGSRRLVPHPGASPQARQRRARWRR